jgi:hypothetical protein
MPYPFRHFPPPRRRTAVPKTNRAGQPVLTRFEARNRLDGIRELIRRQVNQPQGSRLHQMQCERRDLDLAALDTCEAALETLGD